MMSIPEYWKVNLTEYLLDGLPAGGCYTHRKDRLIFGRLYHRGRGILPHFANIRIWGIKEQNTVDLMIM